MNRISDDWAGCAFDINLIPHTLESTTLGSLKAGDRVNLEVDLIARYVERMLGAGPVPTARCRLGPRGTVVPTIPRMPISPVPELVAELAAGRMVILVDEEDRENEGDLMLAADHVTPEAINFMARYGRGLICLTLTRERCERLQLPLMAARNGTRSAPRSRCRSRPPRA